VSLHRGDRVLAVDGTPIDSLIELQDRIFGLRPGAQPSIVIERDGAEQTVQPTLISWSSFEY
jgi:S1-C subfamily serine protease